MGNFRRNPNMIFITSVLTATAWLIFSIIINSPWIQDISNYVPYPIAYLAVLGIAILPGFIFVFILTTLILNKRKQAPNLAHYPNLSILIAAYNEEAYIEKTIEKILANQYQGELEIIVVNDGSTDRTSEILHKLKRQYSQLTVLNSRVNKGKSAVLNRALQKATYDYIVTVDADTWLHDQALTEIVKPMFNSKHRVGAVAGSIAVQNAKESWVTKLQVWDYFISIAAVKRQQGIHNGVLVAQGAFSLYRKEAIQQAGGWLPAVGEDIVLTWGILKNNYHVHYAKKAVAFTHAPVRLIDFLRQRKRWARGLFEAFKAYPNILLKYKGLSKFIMFLNLFFPLIDFALVFVLFPGIVLAIFFQWYLLAGIFTLLVLPLTLLLTIIVYRLQVKTFRELNIPTPKQLPWFVLFLLSYAFIQAPACLAGYTAELLSFKKHW